MISDRAHPNIKMDRYELISSLLSEDATEPPSVRTAWASGKHATCQLLFEGDIRTHNMVDASKEMEGFS